MGWMTKAKQEEKEQEVPPIIKFRPIVGTAIKVPVRVGTLDMSGNIFIGDIIDSHKNVREKGAWTNPTSIKVIDASPNYYEILYYSINPQIASSVRGFISRQSLYDISQIVPVDVTALSNIPNALPITP